MERVSRQGNASAVNEQTLIFSRTKTHPSPTTYLLPTTNQPLCSGTRKGAASGEEGWDDTASAMHTTAIIIVRRRKEGETTAYKRGGRPGEGWRGRVVWRRAESARGSVRSRRAMGRSFGGIRLQSRPHSLISRGLVGGGREEVSN